MYSVCCISLTSTVVRKTTDSTNLNIPQACQTNILTKTVTIPKLCTDERTVPLKGGLVFKRVVPSGGGFAVLAQNSVLYDSCVWLYILVFIVYCGKGT